MIASNAYVALWRIYSFGIQYDMLTLFIYHRFKQFTERAGPKCDSSCSYQVRFHNVFTSSENVHFD